MRFITGRPLTRDEVVREWMPMRTRDDAEARGLGYWVGYAGAEFLGWWSLAVDDDDPSAAELGYRLRRTSWGNGYTTEGARTLPDHGFGAAGLDRAWAETMAVNAGSRRVLERLGMCLEHSYVGEWDDPIPGWEQSEVVYGIARDAWIGG